MRIRSQEIRGQVSKWKIEWFASEDIAVAHTRAESQHITLGKPIGSRSLNNTRSDKLPRDILFTQSFRIR